MFPELHLGPLTLPTYYAVVCLACVISALWFLNRAAARGLARVTAIDFTLVVFLSGFLGARLLHVAFEEPDFYRAHPVAILYFWNGGFVYLGGLIAAFLATLYFSQVRREPFWLWADVATLPISLGYAIGRVGCFLNGCCYGRECHLPWSTHLLGADRHPTQLYATFWNLAAIFILARVERRFKSSGAFFHVWLIVFSLGRIVMEAFRDDPRGPGLYGVSISLWLSLIMASAAGANLLRRP